MFREGGGDKKDDDEEKKPKQSAAGKALAERMARQREEEERIRKLEVYRIFASHFVCACVQGVSRALCIARSDFGDPWPGLVCVFTLQVG